MSNWKPYKDEKRGVVENKYWVINENGETALFKPYDEYKNPVGAEIGAYQVAKDLGVSCAKIEEVTIGGVDGIISYDFREDEYTYCPGGRLWEKSHRLSLKRTDGEKQTLNTSGKPYGDITVRDIQTDDRLKPLEKSVIEMLLFDCLVLNNDRHGANWEMKIDKHGRIAGLAPLFDHGFCMNDESLDEVQFPWDKDGDDYVYLKHENFFSRLCSHYPEQAGEFLERCSEIELPEFCKIRFNVMKSINNLINPPNAPANSANLSPIRRRR